MKKEVFFFLIKNVNFKKKESTEEAQERESK